MSVAAIALTQIHRVYTYIEAWAPVLIEDYPTLIPSDTPLSAAAAAFRENNIHFTQLS